jgi:hypothetical protein
MELGDPRTGLRTETPSADVLGMGIHMSKQVVCYPAVVMQQVQPRRALLSHRKELHLVCQVNVSSAAYINCHCKYPRVSGSGQWLSRDRGC